MKILCQVKKQNSERGKILTTQEKKKKKNDCQFCGKQFANQYSLRTHQKNAHDFLPFKCSLCSNSYLNQADVKRHTLLDHFKLSLSEYNSVFPKGFGISLNENLRSSTGRGECCSFEKKIFSQTVIDLNSNICIGQQECLKQESIQFVENNNNILIGHSLNLIEGKDYDNDDQQKLNQQKQTVSYKMIQYK